MPEDRFFGELRSPGIATGACGGNRSAKWCEIRSAMRWWRMSVRCPASALWVADHVFDHHANDLGTEKSFMPSSMSITSATSRRPCTCIWMSIIYALEVIVLRGHTELVQSIANLIGDQGVKRQARTPSQNIITNTIKRSSVAWIGNAVRPFTYMSNEWILRSCSAMAAAAP